ncbi:MAG: HAD hydrolase family protein [Abditibacteriales bacterium]|nr:HAD hydrolase family protein [Abditibacteriales bacterium]MDW8365412.1 HAD hydrolase family protein [Abditibacteriales bacterium]
MADLTARLRRIRLLALDVDGVLSDGRIVLSSDGRDWKSFDAQDGFGIVCAQRQGLRVALISGRTSEVVLRRAQQLKIADVMQNCDDKREGLRTLRAKYQLAAEEVAFMGDDLFDLPALQSVGVSFAPANAVAEVRERVDYVTARSGGAGAVREVIELILKAQGQWDAVVQAFIAGDCQQISVTD